MRSADASTLAHLVPCVALFLSSGSHQSLASPPDPSSRPIALLGVVNEGVNEIGLTSGLREPWWAPRPPAVPDATRCCLLSVSLLCPLTVFHPDDNTHILPNF